MSGFSSEFLLNEDELCEILKQDYRDEYSYAELGLDKDQLTLIARMMTMSRVLGTPPKSCWLWSEWDIDETWVDDEYLRRLQGIDVASGEWKKKGEGEDSSAIERFQQPPLPNGYVIKGVDAEKIERKRQQWKEWDRDLEQRRSRRKWRASKVKGRGRPGRLSFTLKHLQFLMGKFKLEKDAQEPKDRVKVVRIPSRSSVERKVKGDNKGFHIRNLVYLCFLDRKKLPNKSRGKQNDINGTGYKRPKYYFPGSSRDQPMRHARAIHENVREHKKTILRHITRTKDRNLIPSPRGTLGVFYLGLEEHRNLIEELEPFIERIQDKVNDYRRDLAKKQGMRNNPEDNIWDFDLEEVDKEYRRQLIESAMGKREKRPLRPRIRLPFPLIIIRGDYPPHSYGSSVLD